MDEKVILYNVFKKSYAEVLLERAIVYCNVIEQIRVKYPDTLPPTINVYNPFRNSYSELSNSYYEGLVSSVVEVKQRYPQHFSV